MTVARDTPHRSSMPGSLPARNSYSRSHNASTSLGSAFNTTHRVTRRKSTTLNAATTTSAQAISQAINIDPSAASRRSVPSRNALGSLSQASYPSPPNSLPQPDDKKAKARRASDGSVLTKKKSGNGELKCETCGKGYKHSSCLSKHLWEHTPEWQYTSKLLISKHQQVQLLEAASVLVAMNQDAVPTPDGAKLSDSDNSSASPAASGSDSRDDDISSAETTPPPQGERSFGRRKRYSNASSVVSRSYQSNLSDFASQRPDSSHGRQWSTSSSRPVTAATSLAQSYPDEDQADLAAAVGLLSCSYGTPSHGPTSLGPDVPPVPPLPARYQGMSGASHHQSSLSNARGFHDDVEMEEESYSEDEGSEANRVDEADDGVFGNMEE